MLERYIGGERKKKRVSTKENDANIRNIYTVLLTIVLLCCVIFILCDGDPDRDSYPMGGEEGGKEAFRNGNGKIGMERRRAEEGRKEQLEYGMGTWKGVRIGKGEERGVEEERMKENVEWKQKRNGKKSQGGREGIRKRWKGGRESWERLWDR